LVLSLLIQGLLLLYLQVQQYQVQDLASPPAIGGTAPSTGKFTTLTSTLNVINGATSGAITLAAPAVSGTNTATLPAATGTVMVSGNMPAFSAYTSANQTASAATWTKVQFNNKEFDTANCYDAITNYRFTPTVAGYYQVNIALVVGQNGSSAIQMQSAIYKNGSLYKTMLGYDATGHYQNCSFSVVMYLNGTTDYIEPYMYGSTAPVINGGNNNSAFSASLVRVA
jgi:hypothetical protein